MSCPFTAVPRSSSTFNATIARRCTTPDVLKPLLLALVLIKKPNRIEDAGFKDGVHYIGYRSDAELFALLDFFLAHEAVRGAIARAGRELALHKHTYDQRVAELLQVIGEERSRNARLVRRLSP